MVRRTDREARRSPDPQPPGSPGSGEDSTGGNGSSGSGNSNPGGAGAGGKQAVPPNNPNALPVELLPPEMRNMSQEQIRQALAAVPTLVKRAKDLAAENETLKKQTTPTPEPKAKQKDLNQLIYEDPEGAVDQVLQSKYGQRFQRLEQQANDTAFILAERQYPEISEYRTEIESILEATGVEPTVENITGALAMAVGQKTIADRRAAAVAADNIEPSAGGSGDERKPKVDKIEEEFARMMGFSNERYAELRDRGNYMDIPVPDGKPRKK